MEIWKNIFKYYQISNTGKIRRDNKLLKQRIRSKYLSVRLSVDGKIFTKTIHRLVAEAFIPNTENNPQVNHKDGNKLNNNVENLEWCTVSENKIHAYKTGLMNKFQNQGELNGRSKLKIEEVLTIREIIKNWDGIREYLLKDLAEIFNCSRTSILRITNKTHWNI